MSIRTIKVAAIQFSAEPGKTTGNLRRVGQLVGQSAAQGARLILLPELTTGGYLLTEQIWDTAETMQGSSVSWLKATARQLNVYLGMSFLEAEGSDFFNSFVLATPAGDICGPLVTAMPPGLPAQDTGFPGLSTIADADGTVRSQLGSEPGMAVAEVTLDPARKVPAAPPPHGCWALPVPWFSFFFPLAAYFGARAYARNTVRAERALAVGRGTG